MTVVPLVPSVSTERFLLTLLPSLGLSEEDIAVISSKFNEHSSILVPAPRFKTTLLLNVVPPLQLYPTLDAALVSDTVILLLSSVDEVQLEGEAILRCLQGQTGGVNIVSCVQVSPLICLSATDLIKAPASNPLTPASRSLVQKSLLSFSRYFFPDVEKIFCADTPSESLILARSLCESLPATIHHADGRSWIVAEGDAAVAWEPTGHDNDSPEQLGLLRVVGTVRGSSMSANRLVHLPGFGDYQVAEVRTCSIQTGTNLTKDCRGSPP